MTDSKLTNEQIEEFKQAFKMLDSNGDGMISHNELRAMMKQFGYQASEEEVANMIRNIDQDNNGTIQLEEFLNFLSCQPLTQRNEKDEMLRVFKLFDKDGNGLITKQQLLQGLNQLGESMSQNQALEIIEAADMDGDGNINFQEFVQLMGSK